MAKTTRAKTEINADVADAVEVTDQVRAENTEAILSDPVVMEEPPAAPPPEPTPVTEPESAKAESATKSRQNTPETKKSSGFGGMVVGGVIAAGLGYGVATYAPMAGLNGQMDQMTQLQSTLTTMSERVAALEAAPAPVDTALSARVQTLEEAPVAVQDQSALTEAMAALDARIAAIEMAPNAAPLGNGAGTSPELAAAVEALRAEVDGLKGSGSAVSAEIEAMAADAKARLAEAEAQAVQMKSDAEETARKAMARASVSRLQAALDSGAPYAAALTGLAGMEVPPVLADAAETGLPSQSALEAAFPDAARSALEASLRASMGDTWSARVGAFLQSTTGARSLAPREGSDPDAVLSRAEAAVKARDLTGAMTELQSLPPEGLAAMADFTAMAQKRLDAAAAVTALSAAIEG